MLVGLVGNPIGMPGLLEDIVDDVVALVHNQVNVYCIQTHQIEPRYLFEVSLPFRPQNAHDRFLDRFLARRHVDHVQRTCLIGNQS